MTIRRWAVTIPFRSDLAGSRDLAFSRTRDFPLGRRRRANRRHPVRKCQTSQVQVGVCPSRVERPNPLPEGVDQNLRLACRSLPYRQPCRTAGLGRCPSRRPWGGVRIRGYRQPPASTEAARDQRPLRGGNPPGPVLWSRSGRLSVPPAAGPVRAATRTSTAPPVLSKRSSRTGRVLSVSLPRVAGRRQGSEAPRHGHPMRLSRAESVTNWCGDPTNPAGRRAFSRKGAAWPGRLLRPALLASRAILPA